MTNQKDCASLLNIPIPVTVSAVGGKATASSASGSGYSGYSGTSGGSGYSGSSATGLSTNCQDTTATISSASCGREAQQTMGSSNSTYPSISFDPSGNLGMAWIDTRDGVQAIYFQIVGGQMPCQNTSISSGAVIDPATGNLVNPGSCPPTGNMCLGMSGSGSSGTSGTSGTALTKCTDISSGNGTLTVTNSTKNVMLTVPAGTVNFVSIGIRTGATVRILSGNNKNLSFIVNGISSETALSLEYVAGVVSDAGFVYSVTNPSIVPVVLSETRITCGAAASIFPDIVSDKDGRHHIVYQNNATGNFELYYIQIFPTSVGEKKNTGGTGTGDVSTATVILNNNHAANFVVDTANKTATMTDLNGINFSDSMATSLGSVLVGDWVVLPVTSPGNTSSAQIGFPVVLVNGAVLVISIIGEDGNEYDNLASSSYEIKRSLSVASATEVSVSSFPAVASGTPGSITIGGGTFMPTGSDGTIISYGTRDFSVTPLSNGPILGREGEHLVFRDFYSPGAQGQWVGVSKATDRAAWQEQETLEGRADTPFFIVSAGNPIADVGDFGSALGGMTDVAFVVQSPPDMTVNVSSIILPIKPKCLPAWAAGSGQSVAQNLVPAPKRPLPPTFTDPVDLSGIMTSPLVTADSLSPSRYAIEGDSSGTVFTNLLVDDGRGNLSRLVFNCTQTQSAKPLFILGQRRCGEEYCALIPSSSVNAVPEKPNYSIRLQVWEGADYRADPDILVSGQVAATKLLLDREFVFGPGDDMSTFNFGNGELQFSEGKMIFIVPHAETHTELYIDGIGNGNDVWTASSSIGVFTNYGSPFTLPPVTGLKAPAYYEGTLSSLMTNSDITNNATFSSTGSASLTAGGILTPIGTAPSATLCIVGNAVKILSGPNTGKVYYIGSLPYATGTPPLPPNAFAMFLVNYDKSTVETVGDPSCTYALLDPPLTTSTSLALTTSGQASSQATTSSCSYMSTQPLRLTQSKGNSTHPRLAKTKDDDIWLAFMSDRTGTSEIYAAKYSGKYGQWSTSSTGGSEIKISSSGAKAAYSAFPGITCDSSGDAHIVWHSNETEDTLPDIFYTKSIANGSKFLSPERLSASPGTAMMPDIVSFSDSKDNYQMATWHDNRFGNYEIMTAWRSNGLWESSASGAADTRVTQSKGNSLFPRIAADSLGNIRIVFQTDRRPPLTSICMAIYSAVSGQWLSSGQGSEDSLISEAGTALSFAPDIDIDLMGGYYTAWHDSRNCKMQIFCSYCPNFIPVAATKPTARIVEATSMYGYIATALALNDKGGNPLDVSTSASIILKVTAPGATFVRYSARASSPLASDGEDGWSTWIPFVHGADLDSMNLSYSLPPGNGTKRVYVQVQDAATLGHPIWQDIILQKPIIKYRIELFKDEALSVPMPLYNGHAVASLGETFVRFTFSEPLASTPTFDVVGRGLRLIRIKPTVVQEATGVQANSVFFGRFQIRRDDGVFNVDGPAKIIPYYQEIQ